jgi:uncharacterized protein (DUF1800 family)
MAYVLASAALTLTAQAADHQSGLMFHDGFEGGFPFNDSDASRFLAQATFGPTDADIADLRTKGYDAWLTEQFAAPMSLEQDYLTWAHNTLGEQLGQDQRREAWLLGALGGPDPANNLVIHKDQLRQRVAFALSEIFVVSEQNALLSASPRSLTYYYDFLIKDAFGDYRKLMEDVTLTPAMGVYLNMMGNQRANSAQNIHPDENFAREINQLFGVGLIKLNNDGTPTTNPPDPTYNQDTIRAFAHVFTGWNWYDCNNFTDCGPDQDGIDDNWQHQMIPFSGGGTYPFHDNGKGPDDLANKQLLIYDGAQNGGILVQHPTPDTKTPADDLKFALDNIYNHPNVGPFVSKQLIQRLVTSNPSPAYVDRVATIFNNNRNSPTQLREVVKAILLDREARYGQLQNPATFGKLREPLLSLTHFWRAMDARHICGNNTASGQYGSQPYRYAGYVSGWGTDDIQYGNGVAQTALNAFSVFNFFKPSYLPPGEMALANQLGPEIQLQTDSIIANTVNQWRLRAFGLDTAEVCQAGYDEGDVAVNHAKDILLAGSANGGPADPADRLVDAYNKRFMSGQMSPFMRQALLDFLNPIDSTWTEDYADWRRWRTDTALYLIFTSPEYMIQK